LATTAIPVAVLIATDEGVVPAGSEAVSDGGEEYFG
jgi:hypothetical protein